jgi:hypothetical protein
VNRKRIFENFTRPEIEQMLGLMEEERIQMTECNSPEENETFSEDERRLDLLISKARLEFDRRKPTR